MNTINYNDGNHSKGLVVVAGSYNEYAAVQSIHLVLESTRQRNSEILQVAKQIAVEKTAKKKEALIKTIREKCDQNEQDLDNLTPMV